MLGIYLALIDEPSDKEKFEVLYHTYEDMMSKLAMSILHNEDLVKETLQDCFLKIAEMITEISDVESHRTRALIVIMVKSKARNNLKAEHYEMKTPLENEITLEISVTNDFTISAEKISSTGIEMKISNNSSKTLYWGSWFTIEKRRTMTGTK